jgi:predicted DNA-binding transcriptional regulator AlpA
MKVHKRGKQMHATTIEAPSPDQLLNEKEAASILTVQPATLTTWRSKQSQALPYVKLGRAVRYRRSDVMAFIDAQTHGVFDDESGE